MALDKQVKDAVTTNAEAEELNSFIRGLSNEEKGIDNFFLEVIKEDSLKVGNLTEQELGIPRLPLRVLLELKRDCKQIPSLSAFVDDLEEEAQMVLATSLSKNGFLINARVTQKKELLDKAKKRTFKKSLFGKKEVVEE